jgi:ABC-type iron transport system FetAB ATPase subunit
MADLEIRDLHVTVDNREILKGISLAINKGEVHAVMGPNGSGKSTLSNTLMGHPGYAVTGGEVLFKGKNIIQLTPDERSRLGMFLALQYPIVVPGITMNNFLRTALNAHRGYDGKDKSKAVSPKEFRSLVEPFLDRFDLVAIGEGEETIVEIMRQTPDIPFECQWAVFLRNHDELTLETVTDEERDYMYREYARDPRMRINAGIRRRLAPPEGREDHPLAAARAVVPRRAVRGGQAVRLAIRSASVPPIGRAAGQPVLARGRHA